MAAFILRSDYRIMKLRLNKQKKPCNLSGALAGVQSIRNTDKSTNKLALIVTWSMNKAAYSSLTPIYLPPTQQGENKTATVWTICTPFSLLMSCFPVWRSPWSRADARCPRIMGLLCVPVIASPLWITKQSERLLHELWYDVDVAQWEWQLSSCNLSNEHPEDDYGF